jgi:adenosylcobinamide amidohydrolase
MASIKSTLIRLRDAVPVDAMTTVVEAKALADWIALHTLKSRETDSISERRTK